MFSYASSYTCTAPGTLGAPDGNTVPISPVICVSVLLTCEGRAAAVRNMNQFLKATLELLGMSL